MNCYYTCMYNIHCIWHICTWYKLNPNQSKVLCFLFLAADLCCSMFVLFNIQSHIPNIVQENKCSNKEQRTNNLTLCMPQYLNKQCCLGGNYDCIYIYVHPFKHSNMAHICAQFSYDHLYQ